MIPSIECARCGAAKPPDVIYVGPFSAVDLVEVEGFSICRPCRKSFRRWMKRGKK